MRIRPAGTVALITSVLVLAACGGEEAQPETTAADTPSAEATVQDQTSAPASDGAATDDVARIPDGRYVRVVTTADAEGFDVSPEQVEEFLGRDGELPMALEFDGDNYKQYGTNDAGVEELGDLGTLAYPEDGKVVITSESSGCPGCVATITWSLDGQDYIQESMDPTGEEAFLFNGRWTREDG